MGVAETLPKLVWWGERRFDSRHKHGMRTGRHASGTVPPQRSPSSLNLKLGVLQKWLSAGGLLAGKSRRACTFRVEQEPQIARRLPGAGELRTAKAIAIGSMPSRSRRTAWRAVSASVDRPKEHGCRIRVGQDSRRRRRWRSRVAADRTVPARPRAGSVALRHFSPKTRFRVPMGALFYKGFCFTDKSVFW
jgi:hypothetical protein